MEYLGAATGISDSEDTTSAASTITLTNTGAVSLVITTVALTTGTQFAKGTDNCHNTTVTAGGTCTVQVTFTPLSVGSKSDTLSFTDDGTGSPQTVSLSGIGIAVVTTGSVNSGVYVRPGVYIK